MKPQQENNSNAEQEAGSHGQSPRQKAVAMALGLCSPQPQRSVLAVVPAFEGLHLPAHRLRRACFLLYWEEQTLAWRESVCGAFGTTASKCQT